MRFPLFAIPLGFWRAWGRRGRFPRRETVQHCACSPSVSPGTCHWLSHSWHNAVTSRPGVTRLWCCKPREAGRGWRKKKRCALWKGFRGDTVPNSPGLSRSSAQTLNRSLLWDADVLWGCWQETLPQTMWLWEGEEEKPSMGQAALATPRAVGIFHSSPCPERLVWVFWCYHWDGSFLAVRTLKG